MTKMEYVCGGLFLHLYSSEAAEGGGVTVLLLIFTCRATENRNILIVNQQFSDDVFHILLCIQMPGREFWQKDQLHRCLSDGKKK